MQSAWEIQAAAAIRFYLHKDAELLTDDEFCQYAEEVNFIMRLADKGQISTGRTHVQAQQLNSMFYY